MTYLCHCFGCRVHQTAPVHLLHVWQWDLPPTIPQNASSIDKLLLLLLLLLVMLLLPARGHLQMVLVHVMLAEQLAGRAGAVRRGGRNDRRRCCILTVYVLCETVNSINRQSSRRYKNVDSILNDFTNEL